MSQANFAILRLNFDEILSEFRDTPQKMQNIHAVEAFEQKRGAPRAKKHTGRTRGAQGRKETAGGTTEGTAEGTADGTAEGTA